MSLAVLKSRALSGMHAQAVSVETHLANGLPAFTIVGLPDTEVKEARERVRAAILNSGFDFPARRITVNLAPADLPKESGRFDLPIALGILAASGQLRSDCLDHYEYAGELSLSGRLCAVRGALAMAFAIQRDNQERSRAGHRDRGQGNGQEQGPDQNPPAGPQRAFILPRANAGEAALVENTVVLAASSLLEVCAHFGASGADARLQAWGGAVRSTPPAYPDFADVRGQYQARRALEIAAAGGHNVLMIGPPGAGKSMLAARFAGILPPMSDQEALEAAALQSVSGQFSCANWKVRPFRAPHHSASGVALVGGGSCPRPGEISLAHRGVLFLDELPEFDRKALEVLRQPLENGRITISRSARQAEFPASFQLLAAMNPCPCGYLGHPSGRCRCSPDQVARYQARISGPLLDRIDIRLHVPAVAQADLLRGAAGEASAEIAARVGQARARQWQRQGESNHTLQASAIDQHCPLDEPGRQLLESAMHRLDWSARACHRTLKIARTIADLAASAEIGKAHMAEAIQYRRLLHKD